MFLARAFLIFGLSCGGFATPLIFNVPQTLTKLVSSASAAISAPINNVVNFREKLQDQSADDDFFKDSPEDQQEMSPPLPDFVQRKLDKIVQKIQFLGLLTGGSSVSSNDIPKEKDDFDKDFESVIDKEDLVEGSGYNYKKPVKSAKQQEGASSRFSNVGVFFAELIGSLVGLAYGAAAQLNYGSSTTIAPT